ncbi:hypothetical protein [Bacillus sp. REN3]|uniref:hypothetical protein n=1 Tax=Bacillus sp. REN3 TaxID=2802440 RepID=UPI001AEDD789|nr:hypothetical protein [Bacillus sp. REN3]
MMYLADVKMWEVVRKQVRLKLKSYRGMFTSLMIVQILAILISLSGEANQGGSIDNFEYDLRYYSGNMILAFTMIWAFISAIIMTTKAYRFDDYAFIANRLTSHIANVLFLIVASITGGMTTLFSTQVLKVIGLLKLDRDYLSSMVLSVPEFMAGLAATILYLFLFTAFGYLAGMLVQKNKLFLLLLPAVFFGSIFIEAFIPEQPALIPDISKFFGGETSFWLFTLKVLLVSSITFGIAIFTTNRTEVRQ